MGLSEAALKRRHKYIGASDVPAILGVSPWKTPSDVYYNKTAEFEKAEPTNKAINAGHFLELSCLAFAESQLGRIKRNQFRVHPTVPYASATLDAVCLDRKDEGVEAKSTSHTDNWGEPGTDQIPIYYLAQVQWQMYVTGFKVIHVPMVCKEHVFDFKMYRVERDDALINSMAERCHDFWVNHVEKRVPPKDSTPAPRTLQRMKRVPDKVTEVDDLLVRDWQDKKKALKEAKKAEQESRMRMLESLGDAEVGKFTGGVINYFKRQRKAHTVNVKQSTYRSLEIKEGDGDVF